MTKQQAQARALAPGEVLKTQKDIDQDLDPGRYLTAQRGLYLRVSNGGARAWIFRKKVNGKPHERGLGSYPGKSYPKAREEAARLHLEWGGGVPAPARASAPVEGDAAPTSFRAFAEELLAEKERDLKSKPSIGAWKMTLREYAYPVMGELELREITVDHVKAILQPLIDAGKHETASRLRGRIQNVLDRGISRKLLTDNPARIAVMKHVVTFKPKKERVEHHTAMAYQKMPAFVDALRTVTPRRNEEGMGSRALDLIILTVCRKAEAIGAKWGEFDLENALWTIPKSRMKAGVAHRVPLSSAALSLLQALGPGKANDHVFPGEKGSHITGACVDERVKHLREKWGDFTTHGFRSTFREWAAEETDFPKEFIEKCLAHRIKDAAEAAYWRGDVVKRRTPIMEAWGEYVGSGPGKVIPLRERA